MATFTKASLMDDIAKLLQNQDSAVKPEPSPSASLDSGQFVASPQNRQLVPGGRGKFWIEASDSVFRLHSKTWI